MSQKKILFIFSGSRRHLANGRVHIDFPDTQFYGYSYFSELGMNADFKTPDDAIARSWLRRFFSFPMKHMLLARYLRTYDYVIGSSLLYTVVFKGLFAHRTKFILLNISLNNTLYRNRHKKFRYGFILRLVKKMDRIICLSHVQLENLASVYGIEREKLVYVPLGVDDTFWQPTQGQSGDYILSVGKDNGRDYATLLEAARLLPEEKFVIVCAERNIKGLSVPPNVQVEMNRSYLELRELYRSAKLSVIVTHGDDYSDGSDCSGQTSLLETMASGLPLIVSRKAYLADYLTNNKEAVVIPVRDPQALAKAVQAVMNSSEGQEMAQRARLRVESEFTSRRMAERIISIINSI